MRTPYETRRPEDRKPIPFYGKTTQTGAHVKVFYLYRAEDESGISGTGRVAQGFVADNGRVSLFWLSEHPSVTVYDSVGEVRAIHGHSGKTELRFEPNYKRAFNEIKSALDSSLLDAAVHRLPPEGSAHKILATVEPEPPKKPKK